MTNGIVDAGLTYASAASFHTPRRLTLAVESLLEASPTVQEERKGPKVGAPDQAIQGFFTWRRSNRWMILKSETTKKVKSILLILPNQAVLPQRLWPRNSRSQYVISHGQNQCAGAVVVCVGCGRCSQSCVCCRMKLKPKLCHLKLMVYLRVIPHEAIALWLMMSSRVE